MHRTSSNIEALVNTVMVGSESKNPLPKVELSKSGWSLVFVIRPDDPVNRWLRDAKGGMKRGRMDVCRSSIGDGVSNFGLAQASN